MANPTVVLYTRQGCHLCHDAEQLLIRHGLHPRPVDIDRDPELLARFDACVPVVEINGQIRFRGRIDEALLRRLLRANP
jgi:glutaredoxin